MKDEIIKKQKELIEFYELQFDGDTLQHIYEARLKHELQALESQSSEESKIDINTPFFGNSGAKVPVVQKLKETLQDEINNCLGMFKEPNRTIDSFRSYYEGRLNLANELLRHPFLQEIKEMDEKKARVYYSPVIDKILSEITPEEMEKTEKEMLAMDEKKAEKIQDFKQYVINLLYNAYNDGKQSLASSVFDEWVEQQIDLMTEYASQFQSQISKNPSKEITDQEQTKTVSDELREAFADYMYSEGCSCCQDTESHPIHKERIAKLLNVEPYSDNSGYDFSKYRSKR